MSSRICGAKSEVLHNFAGQRLHCSIKVWNKEQRPYNHCIVTILLRKMFCWTVSLSDAIKLLKSCTPPIDASQVFNRMHIAAHWFSQSDIGELAASATTATTAGCPIITSNPWSHLQFVWLAELSSSGLSDVVSVIYTVLPNYWVIYTVLHNC